MWLASTFRKHRVRLPASDVAAACLDEVHGLVVNTCVTAATGNTEWDAVEILLADCHRATVGGDRNYDVRCNVGWLRRQGLTAHVAVKRRYSAIDARTTGHPAFAISQ